MPGAIPKDPKLRQRRNKTSTRAILSTEVDTEREIPQLPKNRRWHYLTREWWERAWQSPMAPEYLEADIDGMFILALLIDKFWKKPTKELAGEIRLQRQCFGLTPIDRRRLQWEVEKVESVTRKRHTGQAAQHSGASDDPRKLLSVV